jgi:hypothetical protein
LYLITTKPLLNIDKLFSVSESSLYKKSEN